MKLAVIQFQQDLVIGEIEQEELDNFLGFPIVVHNPRKIHANKDTMMLSLTELIGRPSQTMVHSVPDMIHHVEDPELEAYYNSYIHKPEDPAIEDPETTM